VNTLGRLLHAHFGTAPPPTADQIRADLWTSVNAETYAEPADRYQTAILEQYRIYTEMADRISARRGLTNTFFLTINTGVSSLLAATWRDPAHGSAWLMLFPLLILLIQCLTWFWLVRSYRQLNSAKYAVIGALEERLPASPYWRAEWQALGRGEDPARYWPLTHLEKWVPALFAVTYVCAYITLLLV
jgi:hypothetical protein